MKNAVIEKAASSDAAIASHAPEADVSPTIRQNHTVAWRVVEGESVIIDPSCGTVYVLNRVGSRIWELLESPTTAHAIERQVALDHDRDAEQVREDVVGFVRALVDRGLIETVE